MSVKQEVVSDGEEEYEIESIENMRIRKNGTVQYLVRWKGYWPDEQYSWLEDEHMEGAKGLIEDFKRRNPTNKAAATINIGLEAKNLVKETPPVGEELKTGESVLMSLSHGGDWYRGKVEKVFEGLTRNLIIELKEQAAVPRSLADKSLRDEADGYKAKFESLGVENARNDERARHLSLLNDVLANKLRTLINYFKTKDWELPSGGSEVGTASIEELVKIDLGAFIRHFETHPAVSQMLLKASSTDSLADSSDSDGAHDPDSHGQPQKRRKPDSEETKNPKAAKRVI